MNHRIPVDTRTSQVSQLAMLERTSRLAIVASCFLALLGCSDSSKADNDADESGCGSSCPAGQICVDGSCASWTNASGGSGTSMGGSASGDPTTGGGPGTGGATGSGGSPSAGGSQALGGSSSTECPNGPLDTSIANCVLDPLPSTGEFYQDCVNQINAFRWECQCLPPLERWTEAEDCANQHAQYDYEHDSAHQGLADGICEPADWGQCECPGWGSVESITQGTQWYESCLQMMWSEFDNPGGEQGHYDTMSSQNFTRVACGIYVTAEGDVWSVQNYGR